MNAIGRIEQMPELVGAMAEIGKILRDDDDNDESNDDDEAEHLEEARHEARIAKREVEQGFPLLHKHAIVVLWSSLEALVRDLVVAWISNREGALQSEQLAGLKITLSEYEQLEPVERFEHLVDLMEQRVGGSLKRGVNRFECILEPIGLSGPVDNQIADDIYELQQVRNVLLHRNGIADRRFVNACPWLNAKVGDAINVDHKRFTKLHESAEHYILEIIQRTRVAFGLPRHKPEAAAESKKNSPEHRRAKQKAKPSKPARKKASSSSIRTKRRRAPA